MFSFENLSVYKEARELTVKIYAILDKFPRKEEFGICSQIRRAIISVPSNIAEQSSRSSYKEKIRFLEIAYGSLVESYCQLQISVDINYLSPEEFALLTPHFSSLSKQISGLRKSFLAKINANQPVVKA